MQRLGFIGREEEAVLAEVDPEQEKQFKQKANTIFKNIFQEVFLTNCGNPIDFDQTKEAFQKHMGGSLTIRQLGDLEQLFNWADLTNVGALLEPFCCFPARRLALLNFLCCH